MSPLPLTLTLTLTLKGKNTMRNGDNVYFAEYWMRKKHAELGIICGIKNAEKSCYSLLTFDNVSTAVLCAGRDTAEFVQKQQIIAPSPEFRDKVSLSPPNTPFLIPVPIIDDTFIHLLHIKIMSSLLQTSFSVSCVSLWSDNHEPSEKNVGVLSAV